MTQKHSICPLCKESTNKILTEKLRRGEEIPVFHCLECDLGFLPSIESLSVSQMKEYYNTQYRAEYKPDLTNPLPPKPEELFFTYQVVQEDRLSIIKEKLIKSHKLLEIGCSAGPFLKAVQPFVSEITGIEFDEKSAAYASEKLKCKVHTVDISEAGLAENYFDWICSFQVLEHIPDPITFLKNIKKHLKPDGTIYLEVPNLHDSLADVYNLPNHHQFYFHKAHLFYFSKKSLKKLFEKVGLQGEFYFTQDYNFVNHMNWIINDKPQTSARSGLLLPEFDLKISTAEPVRNDLNAFIKQVDRLYKNTLSKNEISANISFVGRFSH